MEQLPVALGTQSDNFQQLAAAIKTPSRAEPIIPFSGEAMPILSETARRILLSRVVSEIRSEMAPRPRQFQADRTIPSRAPMGSPPASVPKPPIPVRSFGLTCRIR